jgi:hypothetical protein
MMATDADTRFNWNRLLPADLSTAHSNELALILDVLNCADLDNPVKLHFIRIYAGACGKGYLTRSNPEYKNLIDAIFTYKQNLSLWYTDMLKDFDERFSNRLALVNFDKLNIASVHSDHDIALLKQMNKLISVVETWEQAKTTPDNFISRQLKARLPTTDSAASSDINGNRNLSHDEKEKLGLQTSNLLKHLARILPKIDRIKHSAEYAIASTLLGELENHLENFYREEKKVRALLQRTNLEIQRGFNAAMADCTAITAPTLEALTNSDSFRDLKDQGDACYVLNLHYLHWIMTALLDNASELHALLKQVLLLTITVDRKAVRQAISTFKPLCDLLITALYYIDWAKDGNGQKIPINQFTQKARNAKIKSIDIRLGEILELPALTEEAGSAATHNPALSDWRQSQIARDCLQLTYTWQKVFWELYPEHENIAVNDGETITRTSVTVVNALSLLTAQFGVRLTHPQLVDSLNNYRKTNLFFIAGKPLSAHFLLIKLIVYTESLFREIKALFCDAVGNDISQFETMRLEQRDQIRRTICDQPLVLNSIERCVALFTLLGFKWNSLPLPLGNTGLQRHLEKTSSSSHSSQGTIDTRKLIHYHKALKTLAFPKLLLAILTNQATLAINPYQIVGLYFGLYTATAPGDDPPHFCATAMATQQLLYPRMLSDGIPYSGIGLDCVHNLFYQDYALTQVRIQQYQEDAAAAAEAAVSAQDQQVYTLKHSFIQYHVAFDASFPPAQLKNFFTLINDKLRQHLLNSPGIPNLLFYCVSDLLPATWVKNSILENQLPYTALAFLDHLLARLCSLEKKPQLMVNIPPSNQRPIQQAAKILGDELRTLMANNFPNIPYCQKKTPTADPHVGLAHPRQAISTQLSASYSSSQTGRQEAVLHGLFAVDTTQQYIAERAEGIQQLHKSLEELQQLYIQFSELLGKNAPVVQRIQQDISDAETSTRGGLNNIIDASTIQKKGMLSYLFGASDPRKKSGSSSAIQQQGKK